MILIEVLHAVVDVNRLAHVDARREVNGAKTLALACWVVIVANGHFSDLQTWFFRSVKVQLMIPEADVER
jgi:hypothetical protein